MSGFASFIHLNQSIPPLIAQVSEAPSEAGGYTSWIVAGVIVLLGLVLYGWSDLRRLSWRRAWAISRVCQTESLRRRVLWVTPLAILGVVVVAQFQQPADQQDAIRQTIKFCLFASGLLVTVTAIILACTNLPREIENRVIYTIVTKPTTRLEIVLGKVAGFARVSGLIIILMGVFTLIYLEARTRPMIAQLKAQLAAEPANSPRRPALQYYVSSGLLGTRSMEWPQDMEIYARPPEPGQPKWMAGGKSEYFVVPFDLNSEQRGLLSQWADETEAGNNMPPLTFRVTLAVRQYVPDEQEKREIKEMGLDKPPPSTRPTTRALGPAFPVAPATAPATAPTTPPPPMVAVRFLDQTHRPLASSPEMGNAGETIALSSAHSGQLQSGSLQMTPDIVKRIAAVGRFYAEVSAQTPATEFGAGPDPVAFELPAAKFPIFPAPDPAAPARGKGPFFYSYPSRTGMRLSTAGPGGGPVAAFSFHGVSVASGGDGKVGLQINPSVDKVGDFDLGTDYSHASVEVVNRKTNQSSGQIAFVPETSRAEPVSVDANFFAGGDFDVLVRNTTPGQWLGMSGGEDGSVALVTAAHGFAFNLVKSLFILWLLSLLVVIIAVFCSTFLSWPIAVVLTLLILLGHWGVEQLGDAVKPGMGRSIVGEFGVKDPTQSQVVSTGVDALGSLLRVVNHVLPDVSNFPVMEDIDRGINIPLSQIGRAMGVVLCYGLPMLVLSYVILRRKEVAP